MITAPYNFVPLSSWIFSPDWAAQVSHDMPFKEGISGCIDIKITAETPILIGGGKPEGKQKKTNEPGEAHFCKIDNRYAIPGTALKGMIRNVLEIASFGKMHFVDNRRLGIRDISGARVREKNYLINGQQAGFLRLREVKNDKGRTEVVFEIVPCKFVHIKHPDMSEEAGLIDEPYLFKEGWSVQKKYEEWQIRAEPRMSERNLPLIRFDIDKSETPETAANLGAGQIEGEIVFTGQISDKNKTPKTGKYRDFVFYNRRENDVKQVNSRVLADFRFIHGEGDKKHQGPWPRYWKEKFFNQQEIPVFYHLDNNREVKSIGLAFMYKLAYNYSIGETIDHTNPEHRQDDKPDLAEVMLGKIYPDAERNNLSLKSRVSFGTCFIENANQPQDGRTTVLSGPKPTYFPNYVRQDKTPELSNNKNDTDCHYRTYMQYNSEIRGWKRYPVRLNKEVLVLSPPTQFGRMERESSVAAQIKLFPLPPQTTFNGKIRFHNLRPEELGALLWVLEWGGDTHLRHNIGMGKPLGFGVIKLEITGGELRLNQNPIVPVPLHSEERKKYHQKFENLMNDTYQKAQKQPHIPRVAWKQSEQLLLLRAMAWPKHENAKNRSLRYMLMGNNNEFSEAKKNGWVLPEYHDIPEQQRDRVLFPRNNPPPSQSDNSVEKKRSPLESWLEEKIGETPKEKGGVWVDKLTGKWLAEQWQGLEEGAFKQQMLEHIKAQWRACTGPDVDWWEKPVTNGMRKAKKIYTQN